MIWLEAGRKRRKRRKPRELRCSEGNTAIVAKGRRLRTVGESKEGMLVLLHWIPGSDEREPRTLRYSQRNNGPSGETAKTSHNGGATKESLACCIGRKRASPGVGKWGQAWISGRDEQEPRTVRFSQGNNGYSGETVKTSHSGGSPKEILACCTGGT